MSQRIIRSGLACALLLASCGPPAMQGFGPVGPAGAQGQPEWVDGATAARFPAAQYLTGVGHGGDRMACENDARAALAKIFAAHVEQLSNDTESHFSRVNAQGKVRVEALAVQQLTRVSTDYVLKGTRLAEVWQGGAQRFHCLAVLDRLVAGRTLRDELDRKDVEIAALVREGDAAPNPTARFFAYKRAMELLQRREGLNAELRIVSPGGAGKPPLHGWEDLVAKLTGSRAQLKVGLKLTGRDAARLQTCLVEQLAQRDVQVLEETSDLDLMVHGELSWHWAGYVNGSYLVQVNVDLRVTDLEGGRTMAAFAERLKTGRPQRDNALQSAANKLCFKVAPQLADKLHQALGR
ncbi:MAG: LPP20 family lipoprotein [Proteobacteria bacterium]|nr:LPP20 family lipoprotein [Pseudomonadota bacterium]